MEIETPLGSREVIPDDSRFVLYVTYPQDSGSYRCLLIPFREHKKEIDIIKIIKSMVFSVKSILENEGQNINMEKMLVHISRNDNNFRWSTFTLGGFCDKVFLICFGIEKKI